MACHVDVHLPDLDPVLAVIGSHECFQFIPPVKPRWTLVDTLWHVFQQTHRDVPDHRHQHGMIGELGRGYSPVQKAQPLQKKPSGVLHSLNLIRQEQTTSELQLKIVSARTKYPNFDNN